MRKQRLREFKLQVPHGLLGRFWNLKLKPTESQVIARTTIFSCFAGNSLQPVWPPGRRLTLPSVSLSQLFWSWHLYIMLQNASKSFYS
jgi:hypothetical protein